MSDELPRTMWGYITRSTMKREFAVALTVWWAVLGTYLMVRLPVAQYTPDAGLAAWGALTIPVLTIAAAAFGTDWVSKQTTIAGPPMNTEIKTTTEIDDGKAVSTTSSETKP